MKRTVGGIVPHLILMVFSAIILMPLVWIVRVSLTDKLNAYKIPPEFTAPILDNYIAIFQSYALTTWFGNSLVVAVVSTAVALPLATGLAYAFARFDTGGAPLRLSVLASQMLPPIILVLPLFTVFLALGMMQSLPALILSHITINLPFLAWMLISFFEGEARQLEEAARVDGATRWQAFVRVAVPVAAPGILAAGLLGFILSWNEFLFALVFSGPQTQTLPVGLAGMETHAGVEIAPLAAATIVSLLPVFVLLPFLRRYLIKGLSLGALK